MAARGVVGTRTTGGKIGITPVQRNVSTEKMKPTSLCGDPRRALGQHCIYSMSSAEATAASNGSPVPTDDVAGRPTSAGSASSTAPHERHHCDGATEHKVSLNNADGKPVEVTIVPRGPRGKNSKRSWVWQVMHEIVPSVDGNNVFCGACQHFLKWKSQHGTRGLGQHYKLKHPELYWELMGDQEEGEGEYVAAL